MEGVIRNDEWQMERYSEKREKPCGVQEIEV